MLEPAAASNDGLASSPVYLRDAGREEARDALCVSPLHKPIEGEGLVLIRLLPKRRDDLRKEPQRPLDRGHLPGLNALGASAAGSAPARPHLRRCKHWWGRPAADGHAGAWRNQFGAPRRWLWPAGLRHAMRAESPEDGSPRSSPDPDGPAGAGLLYRLQPVVRGSARTSPPRHRLKPVQRTCGHRLDSPLDVLLRRGATSGTPFG